MDINSADGWATWEAFICFSTIKVLLSVKILVLPLSKRDGKIWPWLKTLDTYMSYCCFAKSRQKAYGMLLLAYLQKHCRGYKTYQITPVWKQTAGARFYLGHGRAPEIIEEQVADRRRRPQVLVVEDGRDVIKHEAAREAVPVAPHHQSSQK